MAKCNSQAFTDQPIGKLIWQSSLPMVSAILALFGYDLLESSLLALQSENQLTAIGFTLPITAAMTALAIGLSIRTNNKVVHCLCTERDKLASIISSALFITAIIVTFFSLGFAFFNDWLLFLTGNNHWLTEQSSVSTTYPLSNEQTNYLSLRYLGWIFLALIWQINATLRALGWMQTASYLILGWAFLKSLLAIVLLTPESPLFIENLTALGVVHLISDITFTLISFIVLSTKVQLVKPNFNLLLSLRSVKRLDSSLIVIQQFITPISMAVLTVIAANINTDYVAALALLFRLEMLLLLLPMVLTTSLPAILGANYWLGKHARVKQLYQYTFIIIAITQLVIALLVITQSQLLSAFVCPHAAIAQHLTHYLQWVPWGYGAAGIAIVFQSCLNAKNKTVQATVLGFSHRILLVLPLTALGAFAFDQYGFYQGLMLGHVGAIVPVIFLLKHFGFFNRTAATDEINQSLTGIKHDQ